MALFRKGEEDHKHKTFSRPYWASVQEVAAACERESERAKDGKKRRGCFWVACLVGFGWFWAPEKRFRDHLFSAPFPDRKRGNLENVPDSFFRFFFPFFSLSPGSIIPKSFETPTLRLDLEFFKVTFRAFHSMKPASQQGHIRTNVRIEEKETSRQQFI